MTNPNRGQGLQGAIEQSELRAGDGAMPVQRRNAGRVVAAGRALLALAFFIVIWLDPKVPVRSTTQGYLLLSAYLIWAAGLMVVAWRSWWFDYRFAAFAQGVDILMFLAAVYLTESPYNEFQSPFLAFAAFLLIAAMVRWNWRATALTAIILLIANIVFGIGLYKLGVDIDLFRFSRRMLYTVLLSSMLVWLSMSRGGIRAVTLPEPPGIPGERRELVFDTALATVARTLRAGNVAFAFASSEEPWIELRTLGPTGFGVRRLDPEEFAEELLEPRRTALFSTSRRRELSETGDDNLLVARSGRLNSPLATLLGIDEGIIVPVQSVTGTGQIVAWNAPVLCFDDIPLLKALGEEIGHTLDREEMSRLARVEVETDVRQAVARDLHDSVAQFLAGTLFRLEALRRWIREGNDPEGEIDSIKNALRREQTQLRLLIERLRRGQEGARRTEIADELRTLLDEAGAHWHIATELVLPDRPLSISVQLSHEIRQLVREGVANAARHGKCGKVVVSLGHEDGRLRLAISDDGVGFPPLPGVPRPRSISERVEALGGRFEVHNSARGVRLEIDLLSGDLA